MQAMTATIKKSKNNKFNVFINDDGREIPVGTMVGELLGEKVFKTTEFETYEDTVKWIDGSNGKFKLKEDK